MYYSYRAVTAKFPEGFPSLIVTIKNLIFILSILLHTMTDMSLQNIEEVHRLFLKYSNFHAFCFRQKLN